MIFDASFSWLKYVDGWNNFKFLVFYAKSFRKRYVVFIKIKTDVLYHHELVALGVLQGAGRPISIAKHNHTALFGRTRVPTLKPWVLILGQTNRGRKQMRFIQRIIIYSNKYTSNQLFLLTSLFLAVGSTGKTVFEGTFTGNSHPRGHVLATRKFIRSVTAPLDMI
jgi:hypothetical protein